MASNTRIAELAASIQTNTTKLDAYLESQNIKSPSFDVDAPDRLSLPPGIYEARESILEATDEPHYLVLGPTQYIIGLNVFHLSHTFLSSMADLNRITTL